MVHTVRATAARAIVVVLAVLALAAGTLGGSFTPPPAAQAAELTETQSAAPEAQAANMSAFEPGNIIDDIQFWDGYSMGVADVQGFLNSKVPGCAAGYTCLKDYRETTRTVAATPMCSQYNGAANETAATIIVKVAQACGVSPKVILVTLQKEQGLVTHSSPSAGRFRSAMGAGCPDTAACDSTYYGFFNQVHYGAYLLKRYTQPPGTGPGTAYTTRFDLRYPVRQTSAILYHPNANCGTRSVYIENQATHALYIYTPYTPNAAALATSSGTGDSCSSYGNRNFYAYYNDWFGPSHGPSVGIYFREYFIANPWLGNTTGAMLCGRPDSGCVQSFQGGMVAGSFSTVAAGVRNDYVQNWGWYGREAGPLRYPITERRCDNMIDGCRQEFQGGWIVTFGGTRTNVLLDGIRQAWSNWGRELGPLGAPSSDRICADMASGACRQEFQGGWIVDRAGQWFVPNAVLNIWRGYGREFNILGFPTSGPSADPTTGNYTQSFQGGTITVTGGIGKLTATTDPWLGTVLTSPWLGASTQAKSCTLKNGYCYQAFQGGWLVQGPPGVFPLTTAVVNRWRDYGREYNILGYPTSGPSADPATGNYAQTFQGGTITVTGGVAQLTSTTDPWLNAVLTTPWLGASTQAKSCTLKNGYCYQAFAGGWLVQGPTGVFSLPTAVLNRWRDYGREYNILGWPTSGPSADPTTGNYAQTFQGGTITVTGGVAQLTSTTDPWLNTVLTTPWLGTATQAKSCTLKGGNCYQAYQGGWIVQGPTGVYPVPTAALLGWGWYGREYNVLGWPTGIPSADPTTGNYTQTFQGGTVTVTGGTPFVTLR